MLRFLVVVSATTFSSYNPDIAKNRVMPQTWLASPGLWSGQVPGPTWKVQPNLLKQGATTMPTNFRPQIWFQVIISVIGRWCQNEIFTPVP